MTEQSIQGGINDRDTPEQRQQWIKGQLENNRKSLAALGRSVGLSPADAEKVAQGKLVCDPLAIKICRVVKHSKTQLWPWLYENDGSVRPGYSRPS